jgi:hypothetical protein
MNTIEKYNELKDQIIEKLNEVDLSGMSIYFEVIISNFFPTINISDIGFSSSVTDCNLYVIEHKDSKITLSFHDDDFVDEENKNPEIELEELSIDTLMYMLSEVEQRQV